LNKNRKPTLLKRKMIWFLGIFFIRIETTSCLDPLIQSSKILSITFIWCLLLIILGLRKLLAN